jgi:hypothetical protein
MVLMLMVDGSLLPLGAAAAVATLSALLPLDEVERERDESAEDHARDGAATQAA